MNKESGTDGSIAGPSSAAFIMSDADNDLSSGNTVIVPAAKQTKIQTFRQAWLEDTAFRPWLERVEDDPHSAKCTICRKVFRAKRCTLQYHANSESHVQNVKYGTISISTTDEESSMDAENDSSSINTFIVPAAKQVKMRKLFFCQSWLEDPVLQPWLQQVENNPSKGKCTICCKYISAKKSNLQQHANSQEHMKNVKYGRRPISTTDEESSADADNDLSSGNTFIVPAAKQTKRQTFRQAWLKDTAFRPWLERVENDPYSAKCTICCKVFVAKRCNLEKHANSESHINSTKYGTRSSTDQGTKSFTAEVKEAEIRICTDAIEHNRSFKSYTHYVPMAQEAFKNPNVMKCMTLNPKKMKAICINVINKSIVSKIIEKVKGKFFSVLIDETTDTSNMKILCFLLRYVHEEQICTDLLDLIRINEVTASSLYNCFCDSLKKYELSISNLVGVCMDNTNVMLGPKNSMASLLVADNGEICIFPCVCHCIHLAARHACGCLPQHVEKFLHSLYSYFSQNPKRLSMLEGTQQFMTVAKRKALQPSATRWLALAECIKRVLDQWTVLFSVFAEASTEKDSDVAKRIFTHFNCLFTKAYLQFMDYFLRIFTELNKLFQSSTVLLHCLLPECHKLLNLLGGHFIRSACLDEPNIHEIDVNNEANLLPLSTIFTGTACTNTLHQIIDGSSEVNEQIIQFYINVQKYYKTGYKHIVNRVPFHDTFLNALDFLNPEIALYKTKHVNGQLDCIIDKFNSKFNQRVVEEWYHVPFLFSARQKETLKVMSLPQFWHEMSITKTPQNVCILPNISKLAQLCLSLPHSNADVERYFSTVTQIKTEGRNRLNTETVAALTRIKLDMQNQNAHCYNYKITDEMLELFNSSMYNNSEIPQNLLGSLLADEGNATTDSN